MLPSRISIRRPFETPEDIFSSSLGGIFTDDLQNQHGDDPTTIIIYRSLRFGDLEFRTADVNGEEQRRKFAHYLWNAGILMAELEEKAWKVEGETVLELGAGVGLAGIVSALSGAEEVTITDYPAPPIIETITANVSQNVPPEPRSKISIHGHMWGELNTEFAIANAHRYTRILSADCLWMTWEHDNLAQSMLHFLSESSEARIYCIAGFHTGRARMAPFFEETVPESGLEIEDIIEMNADGERREWKKERDGGTENIGERKKWLVVARLKRRISS
ncbi:hypothetical protein P154DRAFT_436327 [Amniculicola lignicola CBS 123094]|uniref:Nicotinamide N-methyltransferase n=1 Tax=Amniculicola lignicola CBS 123094 TaxID=1392246 RepID=A0A6A5WFM9_9PLEO|nr:hypothetical protein P154DRAFT_436327 [Amniculicola lignicola CBS 123094]